MNFFEQRRYRKIVKHLLHEAQHVLHMREDITSQDKLDLLEQKKAAFAKAWEAKDPEELDRTAEDFSNAIQDMYPPKSHPKIRENLEIIIVALVVAMGFRTYFVQPFKIPTGSMQPSLYGITYSPQMAPTIADRFPLNLFKLALFGQRYKKVKAKTDGQVILGYSRQPGTPKRVIQIAGYNYPVEDGMVYHVQNGQDVKKGQILASGVKTIGDHIFVNKVKYNFSRPKRGDIIVFDTSHIKYEQIRPNSFYIKRLAGLPGEDISIHPPYLFADGKKVEEPFAFEWMVAGKPKYVDSDGTSYVPGYTLANPAARINTKLNRIQGVLKLQDDEFLPLGDNTARSLDGRYFGPVKEKDLVGPAFAIYWPVSRRWGKIRCQ